MKAIFSRGISLLVMTLMLLGFCLPASADLVSTSGAIKMHDPTLIQVGSTWYASGTGLDEAGMRLIKSTDNMKTWTRMDNLFTSPLSWWSNYVPNHEQNQWAPNFAYFNGKYYNFYSVSRFGSRVSMIGLISTTNIETGPWSDEGLVINSIQSSTYNAIDPFFVLDANGSPWLSFGSFDSGIKLTQLDPTTLKPTGQLYSIASGNPLEASTITYHDGYYYLIASRGYCCKGVNSSYKMIYGRSTSITGPYLDKNGVDMMNFGGTVLETGNSSRYISPGGQEIYNNLLVYLTYDTQDNGNPYMFVNDLYWDSQKWPTLYSNNSSNLGLYKPVTASSSVDGYNWFANRVNDGDRGSVDSSMGWSSNNSLTSNHTEYLTVDTGAVQPIGKVDLYPRNDGVNTGYGFPIDFTIQVSSDNVNWTTVVTQTGYAQPGNSVQSFPFSPQSARYVKITGTNLRSNPNEQNYYRMQFAETEIYGNIAMSKNVSVSSSIEAYNWFKTKVNDGQRNSVAGSMGWSSNNSLNANHTEYLSVDIGAAHTLNRVDLYPRNDSTQQVGYGFPIDFTIQVSPDNVNWTTVVTQTDYARPGDSVQSFTFTPQSARYVKITGTNLRSNPNDLNAYRMQFAEVEVY